MFTLAKPFFLNVITPLHAGSGSELGIVDLPIQREKHSHFPKIESSGLKGSIREIFEELDTVKINGNEIKNADLENAISLAFGPEQGDAHAGALGFTDAKLLLFPVKSLKGIFAWITCPAVLERFIKDVLICNTSGASKIDVTGLKGMPENAVLEPVLENNQSIGQCITASDTLLIKGNIILEEYSFKKIVDHDISALADLLSGWTGNPGIKEKLVILYNDDFHDFVSLSTEVITRTKINNKTGTVQPGALFTEEYLPAETVLYSLVLTTPIFKESDGEKGVFTSDSTTSEEMKVMEFFSNGLPEIIQIGGNATTGKGLVKTKMMGVNNGQQ